MNPIVIVKPNNTFNIQAYIETNEAFANWEDLGVDNFNSEVPAILTKLAESMTLLKIL